MGLVASWGSGWQAAEEIAQDAFAEAWVGRERFAGDEQDSGAVGAWLRGIAFNMHRAQQRDARRRKAATLEERDVPHETAEHDPRRAALAAAFRKLRAPHQTVLRMHYLEETSAQGVAALLGLTNKAVEGRLYQARIALRAELERITDKQEQEAR